MQCARCSAFRRVTGVTAVIAVPDVIRAKARVRGAQQWLDTLDALVADMAADWGLTVREDSIAMMRDDPLRRTRWLAERTSTDPLAIWEWGAAERVPTALVLLEIGLEPIARGLFDAAEWVADHVAVQDLT
jgi:hypothetical protein